MPSRFYVLFCNCSYAHFCKNVPYKPTKSSYIFVIKVKKKVSLSIQRQLGSRDMKLNLRTSVVLESTKMKQV